MSDESNMSDGPGGPGDLPPTEPVPVDPNLAAASAGAAVPPDPHWYDNRAAVAALIALGLVAIFLLIGWLVWWSDDDDAALVVDGSTIPTVVTSLPLETTVPETTVPETTVPETTVPETTPPTTVPETTVPETTPPTTVPETTVPETTICHGPVSSSRSPTCPTRWARPIR